MGSLPGNGGGDPIEMSMTLGVLGVISIWLCINIQVLKRARGGHKRPYKALIRALQGPYKALIRPYKALAVHPWA